MISNYKNDDSDDDFGDRHEPSNNFDADLEEAVVKQPEPAANETTSLNPFVQQTYTPGTKFFKKAMLEREA